MPTQTAGMIPLVQAAARLKERYQYTWDRVLRGQLRGEQRGRFWYVDPKEVERLCRERDGVQPPTVA